MSKLGNFVTWFRDAVPPLGTASKRASTADDDIARNLARLEAEGRRVRAVAASANGQPRWYVFFYRSGEVPASREKNTARPKESFGPFETREEAVAARDAERAAYEQPRRQYKIRKLTADRYDALWNSRGY